MNKLYYFQSKPNKEFCYFSFNHEILISIYMNHIGEWVIFNRLESKFDFKFYKNYDDAIKYADRFLRNNNYKLYSDKLKNIS